MILTRKLNFNSVHIRIHLPELHEETHSHKEVIIHDDHGHGHGGGGGHSHGGGGFAEGLIGGFLSSGGHGDHGHAQHGGGHSQHGGGFGGHGHGGGGHGHSHGGHSQHGGHGQDDLLIATIGKAIWDFKCIFDLIG